MLSEKKIVKLKKFEFFINGNISKKIFEWKNYNSK